MERMPAPLQVLPRLTSLNRVVFDLIDLYQPALASKRLGSGLDLDPVLPLTWIDTPQLERALGNLFRSAIKETRNGDLFVCRTATDGEWAELTINEWVPVGAREPKVATNEVRNDLGLDASKAIIVAHGGNVELHRSDSRGAWFVVRLPAIGLENARLVEELERGRQIQYDLVTTLSSELRSPLNVILAYNDLLLDDIFGRLSVEQSDTLHRIDRSAHVLLDLIDEALDLRRRDASSRRERGPLDESLSRGAGIAQWLASENARLVAALKQAQQLQSEFVTTMSHQLRVPLNAIIGYVDLLLDGAFGALVAEQVNVLQRARKSALLLLASIESHLVRRPASF